VCVFLACLSQAKLRFAVAKALETTSKGFQRMVYRLAAEGEALGAEEQKVGEMKVGVERGKWARLFAEDN
jgi:hypothetical protein